MTSSDMARGYIEEASGRTELVSLAFERGLWATVVREAQEAVELFLKGSLRLVGVEPARTHDVAGILRLERDRFPDWFDREIDHLATISSELAGDRGIAYYGDERQGLGPRALFEEPDARRALDQTMYVADLCRRLLKDSNTI